MGKLRLAGTYRNLISHREPSGRPFSYLEITEAVIFKKISLDSSVPRCIEAPSGVIASGGCGGASVVVVHGWCSDFFENFASVPIF